MDSKDDSCSIRETSSCVELIMLSIGRNVFQNTVILTLDNIQVPELYFKSVSVTEVSQIIPQTAIKHSLAVGGQLGGMNSTCQGG